MDNKTRLLTVPEVAELLRLSPAAIYALTYRRQIPFIRIGRRLRFDPETISDWLDRQTNNGGIKETW